MTKNMYKFSLQFSLYKMCDSHERCEMMDQLIFFFFSKYIKKWDYYNGTDILYIKNIFPFNLFPQIFYSHF